MPSNPPAPCMPTPSPSSQDDRRTRPTQPLNVPVHLASTYVAGGELEYGRYGNPSWTAFEDTLGALEGGRCVAFASGMAAFSAVLDLVAPGGRVVAPRHSYTGTVIQLDDRAAAGASRVEYVDITDTAAVTAACAGAAMLWFESPTNPALEVADIPGAHRRAHAHGALVAVDNTFATPLLQRPLADGADLVVHSATKYISGHSDVLMGAVVAADRRARRRAHVAAARSAAPSRRRSRRSSRCADCARCPCAWSARRPPRRSSSNASPTIPRSTRCGTPASARSCRSCCAAARHPPTRSSVAPGCGSTRRASAGWSRPSSAGGGGPPRPRRSPTASCGSRSGSSTSTTSTPISRRTRRGRAGRVTLQRSRPDGRDAATSACSRHPLTSGSSSSPARLPRPVCRVEGERMSTKHRITTALTATAVGVLAAATIGAGAAVAAPPAGAGTTDLRVATYNLSLNRNVAGQLVADLSTADERPGADRRRGHPAREPRRRAAQRVRLSSPGGVAVDLFRDNYLAGRRTAPTRSIYPYAYRRAVEHRHRQRLRPQQRRCTRPAQPATATTPSASARSRASSAWWCSRSTRSTTDEVRTFQHFLWKDMPGALLPDDPSTPAAADWYSPEELDVFRLVEQVALGRADRRERPHACTCSRRTRRRPCSTVPRTATASATTTRSASGPTTSRPARARGTSTTTTAARAASSPARSFVILGDQNADPLDGDSVAEAIDQLLDHPRITDPQPTSPARPRRRRCRAAPTSTPPGRPRARHGRLRRQPGAGQPARRLRAAVEGPARADAGVFWPVAGRPAVAAHGRVPVPVERPPARVGRREGARLTLSIRRRRVTDAAGFGSRRPFVVRRGARYEMRSTTLPFFCPVSTYWCASTMSSRS